MSKSKSKVKKKTTKSAEPTLSEQLRTAMLNSGLSVYAIAKGSGVSQPVAARFANGERDIRLETAGKLFAYLGMRATEPNPPAPSPHARKR